MLVIKDLSQAEELTSKEMSAVVGGWSLGAVIDAVKIAVEVGPAVGTLAGMVYCATQGPNCGGATTKPKSNT